MSGSDRKAKDPRAAGEAKIEAIKREAARDNEVASLLDVASDILENRRATMIDNRHAVDAAALWMLYSALTGISNDKVLSGIDRKALFDTAMRTIGPAIEVYAQDVDQREWVAERITPKLSELQHEIEFSQADDRVRGATVLPGNHVVDPNDDRHPREQAELLHEALPKLVETVMQLNEMVVGLHDEEIEEQLKAMFGGLESEGSTKIGSLVELSNALSLIGGYLVLTDDELREHLRNAPGTWSQVRTIGELVKGVVAFTGGALGIVTSGLGLVARAAGEPEIARLCAGFSRGLGLKVGEAVAFIESLRAVATLFDGHATREQKVEAGADIATIGVSFVLRRAGIRAVGGIALGPATIAAQLGVGELKLALNTYWGASQGLVAGLMGPAFDTLRAHGAALAGGSDEILKAETLLDGEQDPAQKNALAQVLERRVRGVGEEIDSLLADLAAPELEAGMARHPGAYKILRRRPCARPSVPRRSREGDGRASCDGRVAVPGGCVRQPAGDHRRCCESSWNDRRRQARGREEGVRVMTEQDCPEPLRHYLDASSRCLRFRSRALTFTFWLGLALLGVVAIIGLVFAIVSAAERQESVEVFAVFALFVALWVGVTFGRWTELDHRDGEWVIQRGFWRWRSRTVRVRDADVMTVFVRTTSSWPDFDKMTSLKIEFPALPFAGPPAPVELFTGYGVPKVDLAHLGKMFEDYAQAAKAK